MKIGINLLLWTDHPSPGRDFPLLETVKGWGFDGVEIPVDALSRTEVRGLSDRLGELGLGCTAISALNAAEADPASPDPKLRQAALDRIKRSVEHTAGLGASLLCGPLFQGLGRFTGRPPLTDERKYAAETLRQAGEFAGSCEVRLALEPLNRFEMYIANTVQDGAAIVREIGLPNVGLLVDTHHSNIEEADTVRAWAGVKEHIAHVHLSENHRGVPGSGHAIPPGVFRLLQDIGYDGWLTIEAFGQNVPDLIPRLHLWRSLADQADDPARLGIEFIRRSLQALS